MEKYIRGAFNWVLCIAGFTFFVSLYFDDFKLEIAPRTPVNTRIPQIESSDSREVILQKMAKYSEVVQHHCKELRARGLFKYKEDDPDAADNVNLLVSDKYKFMTCKAAGVAGSNIHRIVYSLQNNIKDANVVTAAVAKKQVSDLMLNSYDDEKEKIKRLEHYTKFMLIRDPLERVLSAYRAQQPQTLWSGAIQPNFKSYLSHYLNADHPMVPPWREVWKLCNPCEIKYDYIVPLEVFKKGITAILSELKVPNMTLPTRDGTNYSVKSSQQMTNLFYNKHIPLTMRQNLREKCKIDYFLFYEKRYFK